MDKIFELVDRLAPAIGPEGVFALKVVAIFLINYYLFVGIPVALSIWIAYKLTWPDR